MMSVIALHATGKEGAAGIVNYLMDSVCDDEARGKGMKGATAYYAEGGTPAGRWMGGGLAGLGNASVSLSAGDKVEATQLLDLIGDMVDPLTGEQLGRKPQKAINTETRKFDPSWGEEMKRAWAAQQVEKSKEKQSRAVHGFDLTFAPSKDISVLWALSDEDTRAVMEQCHREAIEQTLAMLEDKALFTRRGKGGVEQVKTGGLIAAGFNHWDTREGDPHLHTHVVVVNRVQGPDGKWRTIDSRHGLMPAVVGLSEAYDSAIMDRLTERLGFDWTEVSTTVSGKPVWGINGLNRDLVKEFSTRRGQILRERGDGATREDDKKAWSDTRKDKHHHQLGELTRQWRERALRILGKNPAFTPIQATATGVASIDEIAVMVIDNLQKERATWGIWNMQAEAHRLLRKYRYHYDQRQAVVDQVVDKARELTVQITGGDTRPVTETFQQENTAPAVSAADRYTTRRILDAERLLLNGNDSPQGPALQYDQANQALEAWVSEDGFKLDSEQIGAAFEIVTSGRAVDILVGPAGAGKTTTLSALVAAWKTAGVPVAGFAPSAAAAKVLAEATGQAATIASWTVKPQAFQPGQLVIVDEAAMSATLDLAALAQATREAGAKLLLVGDHHQLSAVEAGGAFSMLVRHNTTTIRDGGTGRVITQKTPPTLEGVRRFRQPWEAGASLLLREGKKEAVKDYLLNDRIKGGGDTSQVAQAILKAWWADYTAGKTSLMLAHDNTSVNTLNEGARELMIQAGIVDTSKETTLRGDQAAGAGDTIVTRLNDKTLGVINGQVFTVTRINRDGGIDARDQQGFTHRLPAEYVKKNVELGYAGTVHRAQGRTVDTVHTMVTETMTRQQLYVAMTRGRANNTAWCVTQAPDIDGNPTGQLDTLDVFTAVATSSGGEKSATEIMELTQNENQGKSYRILLGEYEKMCAIERAKYWAKTIAPAGVSPENVRKLTGILATPEWTWRTAAMDQAVTEGRKPEELLPRKGGETPQEWIRRLDALPPAPGVSPIPQECSEPDRQVLATRRQELGDRKTKAYTDAISAPWWANTGGRAPISQHPAWQRAMMQVIEWRLAAGWENPNQALPHASTQPGYLQATQALATAKRLNEMAGGGQPTMVPTTSQTTGLEM
ncbi:conjugative relaxase-like TrwC/TraI family protein [Mobiluncus mulieris]|uniref:Multifunctional conjugation protein TraI n=1 Tax=Mobiluncus mulieris TaxID=2052 RepID=A0A8G2M673_9ACTO|nr:MobF family relaxase [Mobiluncus mulieris]MBB5845761.1 conjugative relaxase-like TrwC/TraI family protein [Mobiluncus mulieris]STO15577.1 Multifunctional conjugation protein TraI [Mobiluncus mulieris]